MMKKIGLLLSLIFVLFLQSCDFYDIGKKDFRLQLPVPSDTEVAVEGYNAYGFAGGKTYPLDEGQKVRPIAEITFDRSHSLLSRTRDEQMCVGTYMLAEKITMPGEKSINSGFRHYDRTTEAELIGLTENDIVELWGDYTYKVPDQDEEGMSCYIYPYIMLMQNGAYFEGVKLLAGPEGIISEVKPLYGEHRNAFGNLPFYEKILSLNIMEWLMPGLWIDKDKDTPSRGIFFSIICSLLVYGIVLVLLSLVCSLIYLPVERMLTPIRLYAGIAIGAAAICVEYVFMVSLLDYYSAAWWVTCIFMLVWSVAPLAAMSWCTRQFCPNCHGDKWYEESNISDVEIPRMSFDLKWVGSNPTLIPAKESEITITYNNKKTCTKCGYTEYSHPTTTGMRPRTLCPRCFKETVKGQFTKFDTYSDNSIDVEYEERCTSPGCGYRSIHTVNKTLRSRPVSSAGSSSRSGGTRPASNTSGSRTSSQCIYLSGVDTCNLGDRKYCRYYVDGIDPHDCPYFKSR